MMMKLNNMLILDLNKEEFLVLMLKHWLLM